MALQFNHFAAGPDHLLIAEQVLETFPRLVIIPRHGTKADFRRVNVATPPDLVPKKFAHLLLIPQSQVNDLVIRKLDDGRFSVQIRDCPVIEYCPSWRTDDSTVKIGRFYFASNHQGMRLMIQRLFSRLRKRSSQLQSSRGLWVFPHVAVNVKWFRPWAGRDWPNPAWHEGMPGTTT